MLVKVEPSCYSRRAVLAHSALSIVGATALSSLVPRIAHAQYSDALREMISRYTKGAPIQEGRVKFDIAPLIDNGNSIPIEIEVQSPMTEQNYVRSIAIFNEKNPAREPAYFYFTPANGVARVSTRIRLATSQWVTAIAGMNDGSFWIGKADVVVSIAACIED